MLEICVRVTRNVFIEDRISYLCSSTTDVKMHTLADSLAYAFMNCDRMGECWWTRRHWKGYHIRMQLWLFHVSGVLANTFTNAQKTYEHIIT